MTAVAPAFVRFSPHVKVVATWLVNLVRRLLSYWVRPLHVGPVGPTVRGCIGTVAAFAGTLPKKNVTTGAIVDKPARIEFFVIKGVSRHLSKVSKYHVSIR